MVAWSMAVAVVLEHVNQFGNDRSEISGSGGMDGRPW